MNYRFSAAAEQDMTAAALWYEQQTPGSGYQLIMEIEETLKRICSHPYAYPMLYKEFRRALTDRFPYGVIYTLAGGDVEIIAVFHTHRNPESWQQ